MLPNGKKTYDNIKDDNMLKNSSLTNDTLWKDTLNWDIIYIIQHKKCHNKYPNS